MEKPGQLLNLLTKYLNNESTMGEAEELMKLFHTDDQYLLDQLIIAELEKELPVADIAKAAPLPPYIYKEIQSRIRPVRVVKYKLWPRVAMAAAAITAITLGAWLYYTSNTHPYSGYANHISPGKTGATLTLANGKKIRLADAGTGKLAEESGVRVTKMRDGQLIYEIASPTASSSNDGAGVGTNVLSTANGETYQVRLPDGTAIWLNAASTLKYPASFAKLTSRSVELTGEAYFQVAKDKAHPFIVKTDKQQVQVLGTHFSINNYEDEPVTKTTLEEGSVKVSSRDIERVIKPGEQAVFNGTGFKVIQANLEEELAWKNGYFRFNAEKIESIMRKISRWYNIEVVYQGNMPASGLYGTVSRSKDISQVLTVLELTKLVHFKIEGRKVLVIAN